MKNSNTGNAMVLERIADLRNTAIGKVLAVFMSAIMVFSFMNVPMIIEYAIAETAAEVQQPAEAPAQTEQPKAETLKAPQEPAAPVVATPAADEQKAEASKDDVKKDASEDTSKAKAAQSVADAAEEAAAQKMSGEVQQMFAAKKLSITPQADTADDKASYYSVEQDVYNTSGTVVYIYAYDPSDLGNYYTIGYGEADSITEPATYRFLFKNDGTYYQDKNGAYIDSENGIRYADSSSMREYLKATASFSLKGEYPVLKIGGNDFTPAANNDGNQHNFYELDYKTLHVAQGTAPVAKDQWFIDNGNGAPATYHAYAELVLKSQYKIAVYTQDADGNYPLSPTDFVIGYDVIGKTVTVNESMIDIPEGYHIDKDHLRSKLEGAVEVNDGLDLEVYLARDSYTVTYTDGVDGEEVFADQTTSVLYEGKTPGFKTDAYDGKPYRKGYTFDGWTPDVADTVTGDVVYKATWKADQYPYYVEYVDAQTKEPVAEPKDGEAQDFGTTVTEQPVEVDGYTTPDAKSFVINADENKIVFEYTKRTDLSYKVNYLEKGTNKVLHDQKVVNDQTFEDEIKAANEIIDIDGYDHDSTDKETITIGTGENVINVYYTKRTDLSYVVNYLEQGSNKVLHDQKVVNDQTFEDEIKAADEIIDIDGYVFDSVTPETLVIAAQGNVINVYYKEMDAVTINYVASEGGKVSLDKESLAPVSGIAQGSAAEHLAGYSFTNWTDADGNQVTTDLIFTPLRGADNLWHAATYTANFVENDVTINYTVNDENAGEVDFTSENLKAVHGEAKGATPVAKPGYHFVKWVKENTDTALTAGENDHFAPQRVNGAYESATYVAVFEEDPQITITYVATLCGDRKVGQINRGFEDLKPATGEAEGSEAFVDEIGYHFVNWTKKVDGVDVEVSTNAKFVPERVNGLNVEETYYANFAKSSFGYTVTYHYADANGNEIGTTVVSDTAEFESTIPYSIDEHLTYNGQQFAFDGMTVASPIVTSVAADNTIDVYYGLDEITDPSEDNNGDQPGDGTPDKYQATVDFAVNNGSFVNGFATSQVLTFSEFVDGQWQLKEVAPTTTIPADGTDMVATEGHGRGSWLDDPAGIEVKAGDKLSFTYVYIINEYTVTVNFVDEDGNVIDEAASITVDHGDAYDMTDTIPATIVDGDITYVLDGTEGALSVDTATGDATITATYAVDAIGDNPDDPTNPNVPDGIADKYQAVVNYVAGENGSVDGATTKVITLMDGDEPATQATVTPGTEGVFTNADEGYEFNAWDNDPAQAVLMVGGNTYTYTASFSAVQQPTPGDDTPAGDTPAPGDGGAAADGGAGATVEIADDGTPLAAPEETTIEDDANPLAHINEPHCWTHWLMILGMIATIIYGLAVVARRNKTSHDIDDFEGTILGNNDDATVRNVSGVAAHSQATR